MSHRVCFVLVLSPFFILLAVNAIHAGELEDEESRWDAIIARNHPDLDRSVVTRQLPEPARFVKLISSWPHPADQQTRDVLEEPKYYPELAESIAKAHAKSFAQMRDYLTSALKTGESRSNEEQVNIQYYTEALDGLEKYIRWLRMAAVGADGRKDTVDAILIFNDFMNLERLLLRTPTPLRMIAANQVASMAYGTLLRLRHTHEGVMGLCKGRPPSRAREQLRYLLAIDQRIQRDAWHEGRHHPVPVFDEKQELIGVRPLEQSDVAQRLKRMREFYLALENHQPGQVLVTSLTTRKNLDSSQMFDPLMHYHHYYERRRKAELWQEMAGFAAEIAAQQRREGSHPSALHSSKSDNHSIVYERTEDGFKLRGRALEVEGLTVEFAWP